MRVLTWNIHKGIGGIDRKYSLDRVISVLAHCDADLLFLQEVDHGARRSEYHQQSEILADALNLNHYAIGLNHRLRGAGAYGNVTLSRWPIRESFNLDISFPLKKRRGALYAAVDVPGLGMVHGFNFHLGLAGFERMAQIREILRSPRLHHGVAEPAIIAGDSNDWQGRLCERELEPRGFRDAAKALKGRRSATFPAFKPMLSLDRLYFRGLTPLALPDDPPHPEARRASDHLPLLADFATSYGDESTKRPSRMV